jgi:fumarylpyruvate hydrolase
MFERPAAPGVPVSGQDAVFPVRRVFCVGRNYVAHAEEMGNEVDREAPFYFTKSAHAICLSGGEIPYPPGTSDCHYEMEFVVALGVSAFRVNETDAMNAVFGYACGIDLTRRDLQAIAKSKGRPWDLGKDFQNSAIIAPISPAKRFGAIGEQRISLSLDGNPVQEARLNDMAWSVPELISHLSRYYHLQPGDLIYTGTPAGVGPVAPGSELCGRIDGLDDLALAIGPAE